MAGSGGRGSDMAKTAVPMRSIGPRRSREVVWKVHALPPRGAAWCGAGAQVVRRRVEGGRYAAQCRVVKF